MRRRHPLRGATAGWWPELLLALMLASVLTLTGCASPPRQLGEAPWTTGRMSLRVQALGEQPERSFSAPFELRGDSRQGELNIQSPLGTRLAAARWAPGSARLSTPQGEQDYTSLDELSRQALGEALPLTALPDWLAGRPWPQATHQVGHSGFEQLGWSIDLSRQAEGWIVARRDAPPAVLLRVKLDAAEAGGARS